MNWLENLSQTYDDHAHVAGQFELKKDGREYALIPLSHTTQTAHIEVHLDMDGHFLKAKVVGKDEGSTIIPCTEAAASRTSAPVPYPLFDKLMYVAGDYARYCEAPKGTPHQDYLSQLQDWCNSPYGHRKVRSVYEYARQGTLIEDLVRWEVLHPGADGKLLGKCTPELEKRFGKKPEIFNVIVGDQSGAFVRFAVHEPGQIEHRLWRDTQIQESFTQYYASRMENTDLCYVSGEWLPIAEKHASRIRHSGDKSKLISANDSSGFTYRGRFRTSREAAVVSYEVSQKAHNALKWLIERQGTSKDGKVFLVWGSEQLKQPEPQEDIYDLFAAHQMEPEVMGDSTHKQYALQVRDALVGFRYDPQYASIADVTIMILDAATPGRMSIVYYRNLDQNVYIDQLEHWYITCHWRYRYRKNQTASTGSATFVKTPTPKDIAFAAYGPRASDKVVKGLMERILPCIVDQRQIPLDIVRSAVQRASNPVGMDEWDWQKTLSIACALLNKRHAGEGYGLHLKTESTDRSYLFGRLLAVADVLEERELNREKKRSGSSSYRATNAVRYMNVFSHRPLRTWKIIYAQIQPYLVRMGDKSFFYNKLCQEIMGKFELQQFNDEPLTGLFLMGYYNQRDEMYTSKQAKEAGQANLSQEALQDSPDTVTDDHSE